MLFNTYYSWILCLVTYVPNLINATDVWVPESGGDWTELKPDFVPLEGSLDTVSFPFGIVVSPYVLNQDGEYEEPTISSIIRSLTTTVVTPAPKPTRSIDVINQIEDGQIQKTLSTVLVTPSDWTQEPEEECLDDGEEEGENPSDAAEGVDSIDEEFSNIRKRYDQEDYDHSTTNEIESPVYAVACTSNTTLQMTLTNSILRDSSDRIGCIVSGHQFQFDGPVPQYGAIYAAGWSITDQGQLALGESTKFFQCASGEFYNLYDQPIGYHCQPVTLDVVELIEC
ncbi:uncharacterized protein RJT21DRAFT_35303 [Scheffersomyces amazonensis]|uniref:uncharacterized protein n=1 Tax=Scheffersomyces amazonensis TaxID=1078765 RepID=UPI00315CA0D3